MNPTTKLSWLLLHLLIPVLCIGQQTWPLFIRDNITKDPVELAYRSGSDLINRQADARNEFDLLLRSVSWNWDDNQKTWILSNQINNTYNLSHQLVNDIGQQWINGEWIDQYRTTYVYNENGLIRLFQYEAWNGTNWELYVRFIHAYNDNNRLHEFTAQDWIDNIWVNRYKRNFEYNKDLGFNSETRMYWQNESWVNRYRYTDYLDEHARVTSTIRHDWIDDQWQYSIRNMLEYGCYTEPELINVQKRVADEWHDMVHIQLAYNAAGKLTDEIYHYVQPEHGNKDNGWTFSYDRENNMIERSFWSECEPYWQPQSRGLLSYDEKQRNMSITNQHFTDYWNNQSYLEYEYLRVTAIEETDLSDMLSVFPNPAEQVLQVSLSSDFTSTAQIFIVSMLGERLWSAKTNSNTAMTIPVHFLPPGNYLLSVTGVGATTCKIFTRQ